MVLGSYPIVFAKNLTDKQMQPAVTIKFGGTKYFKEKGIFLNLEISKKG